MKKLLIGSLLIILVVFISACASSAKVENYDHPGITTTSTAGYPRSSAKFFDPNSGQYFDSQSQLDAFQSSSKGGNSPAGSAGNESVISWTNTSIPSTDRMIVRTGQISLVVSDISKSLDNIAKMAGDFGGYVVTSQKWKDNDRNYGNISIRVLAENYDKAISSLRNLSLDVISETTSSQDVTEEYSDLGAGLKNLETTETQLLKIMENAVKTEDILSIQRELTNVRGQIEQTKGRMLYLERTSATSLINIQLSEAMLTLKFNADKVRVDIDESILFTAEINGGFAPYSYQWDFGDGNTSVEKSPTHAYRDAGVYSIHLKVTDDKGYTNSSQRSEYITATGNWNPGSVVKSAWSGFSAFGRAFVNILIWIGIFSPVWIVVGGIIWLVVWRNRKKKA
jgi:PKD repeat protein